MLNYVNKMSFFHYILCLKTSEERIFWRKVYIIISIEKSKKLSFCGKNTKKLDFLKKIVIM